MPGVKFCPSPNIPSDSSILPNFGDYIICPILSNKYGWVLAPPNAVSSVSSKRLGSIPYSRKAARALSAEAP
jgi:hypothetical protein